MKRRSFVAVFALACVSLGLGVTPVAHALDIRAYDAATLAGLQGAGKPVAVHFHADWCPTCVNQTRTLEKLKAEGQLQGVTVLVANYDTEADLKRAHKVRSQSVLVVFKGATEVARLGGESRAEPLRQALAKAL